MKRTQAEQSAAVSQRPPRGCCFGISTRLARAVGKKGRYASDAVRALPGPEPDHVVLEATDGCQAVCLMTQGQMAETRLVPADVLPTRQLTRQANVQLVNGHWQSSEGRLAPDALEQGEGAFPPIGDVLPAVGRNPACESLAHAQRRQRSRGQASNEHVVLGIDVDLLRKQAEALGTSKLTLLVPIPIVPAGAKREEICVNRAVPILPASEDGVDGIGVVMPVQPSRPIRRYEKLREAIVEAEQKTAARNHKAKGGNGHA